MTEGLLKVLDVFMLVFHACFIVFVLLGWMVPAWRRVHLVCVWLTAASWSLLGLFYGFGYCPFTDWHWRILERLGERGLPASYVQYLFARVAGIRMSADFADGITLMGLLMAMVVSVYMGAGRRA